MLQVDKMVVVCSPSRHREYGVFGSAEAGVDSVGENGAYRQDVTESKRVIYQYVGFVPGRDRQASVQMHLRRSSVAFIVLNGDISEPALLKQITMWSAVCAAYNRKAPCIGPNVKLHYVIHDVAPPDVEPMLTRIGAVACRFGLSVRASVFGADLDPKGFGFAVDRHDGVPSIPALAATHYLRKAAHWRSLPAIHSERHGEVLDVVRGFVASLLREGGAIIENSRLLDLVLEHLGETDNSFLRYDVEMCLDALDKEGAVRVYSLDVPHVFLDVAHYPMVARHVLGKANEISAKRAEKIVPLEVDDFAAEGEAAEYLAGLRLGERRKLIQSILSELIFSRVLGGVSEGGRQYIIKPLPVSPEAWPAEITDKLVYILAKNRLDIYPRAARFTFHSEKNIDVLFCDPEIYGNKINIHAIYASGTGRNMAKYLTAIEDPKKNSHLLEWYWRQSKNINNWNGIVNKTCRFASITAELSRISVLLDDYGSRENLDVRVTWHPFHDVIEPTWDLWSVGRSTAVKVANCYAALRKRMRQLSGGSEHESSPSLIQRRVRGAAMLGDRTKIRAMRDEWAVRNSGL